MNSAVGFFAPMTAGLGVATMTKSSPRIRRSGFDIYVNIEENKAIGTHL